MKPPVEPQKEPDSFLIAFGIYGAAGIQLALAVVGGLYLGSLAEEKWGGHPWVLLLGLLLGCVGGFYNLIRILNWKEKRKN